MKWLIPFMVLVLCLAGCGFLEKAKDTAITPDANGVTPISQVIGAVPRVSTNPLDIGGWAALLGGIATIVLGGLGYTVHGTMAAKKKVANLEVENAVSKAKSI